MNLACLLLSLWLLGSAPLLWATSVQPDVEFLGQPPLLSSFTSPAARIAMPEGDWQRVQLPHTLAKRTLGYASERVQSSYYRLTVPPSEQPLFLYLPRWQTVGQLAVYGDGRLLWRSSGDRVWNGFNTPLWLALDPLDGQPRPRQLLLRLDSVEGLGGGISSLWLGSEEELLSSYRLRHTLQITLRQPRVWQCWPWGCSPWGSGAGGDTKRSTDCSSSPHCSTACESCITSGHWTRT